MNKEMKESKLKVMEALQEEAYKGIVRIDSETMHVIGVRPGDIIEIEGQRKTVGIVDRAYPTDVGQQVIRMDGIIRRNAKTSIGETVTVRKANVGEAKSVTIAPSQAGIMIQASPEIFRRGLLGRAVIKGDIISLGGARRRRRTMEDSPFEDIFNVFEEGFMGSFGLPSLKFIVVDTNPKQPVIISENTMITASQKATEVIEEKIPEVNYEDLGGLDEEIKKIREMVELPLKHPEIFTRLGIEPPSGVLLHGPPGSGKTLLAKAVANESEANFMLINGPEIMNKFYGESEKRIRDIFEEAEKNAPSIIFIDEIDAIAPKREETRGEVERRVVAQLLTMMDGLKARRNVVVIGATNRPNEKEPISEEVLQKLRVTAEDFKEALKIVRPSAIREVSIEKPNVQWKDIGGLQELKQELIEAVEWPLKHTDAFKRLGIRPPRGILMYGPPGTGKTLLAKAVATESEANFINLKGPSLLNMWVGESERGIRQIFEKARQASPAIIFFDEIDAIAPRRGLSVGTRVTERMLNTLLAEMDGLEELNDVVVIAATNRPDMIDPALLRPGRFDRILSTQMPDKKSRSDIFKIHTAKIPLSPDVNINKLVELTENFSGADVESVCREAAMLALRESIKSKEVRMDHFLGALKKTGPSLSSEDAKRYKEIEEELKIARTAQTKQETPSYLG